MTPTAGPGGRRLCPSGPASSPQRPRPPRPWKAAVTLPAAVPCVLHDLRAGWHEFTARGWVWATVVNLAFANLLATALYVLGPVVANESLGGPSAWR